MGSRLTYQGRRRYVTWLYATQNNVTLVLSPGKMINDLLAWEERRTVLIVCKRGCCPRITRDVELSFDFDDECKLDGVIHVVHGVMPGSVFGASYVAKQTIRALSQRSWMHVLRRVMCR